MCGKVVKSAFYVLVSYILFEIRVLGKRETIQSKQLKQNNTAN